ncbi:hypothetical protein C4J81_18105 [Deltaproteobacteria bacterium Smac51]|nr:hypothetical protein C4J81_18105 [Deltaproteobacteria bacterium Smac51]
MRYDAFTFYSEFDLLELRLNTLNDVIDRFILVEGDRTFSNEKKPLHFTNGRDSRFDRFMDKLTVITVTEWPEFETAWTNEAYQRNCLMAGLSNCDDDDVIVVSDLDEIPSPSAVLGYKPGSGIKALEQYMFYYAFNNLNMKDTYWYMGKILDYRSLRHALDNVPINNIHNPLADDGTTTPTKVRLYKTTAEDTIKNGGWHFSYLMSPEQISHKIKIFAHQEFNYPEFTDVDTIKKRVAEGHDLFSRRGTIFAAVPLDDRFPPYLRSNKDRFSDFILPYNPYRYWSLKIKIQLRATIRGFYKKLEKKVKKIFRPWRK